MAEIITQEQQAAAHQFAAIDITPEVLIESPKESRMGSEWVRWGDRNTYPQYVESLTKESPTLRSVIMGTIDYICGNAVNATHGLQGMSFDRKGTSARKIVKDTARSILTAGGFAWKITNNLLGTIAEIEVIPMKYLRTDEDKATFWYNEKWGKSYECVRYPAWVPGTQVTESIYYVQIWGDEVYPEPVFAASVKDAETERAIAEYHLGNISRGFMGTYLFNFNGGIPNDKQKEEIEKNMRAKFGGSRNAGRFMLSFNPNVQNRMTVEKMDAVDFASKYESLSKHCRQSIFTAFRANPNLFGIATESNGFNSEEYDSAFRLFNRTMVQPIQAEIIDAFEVVMGEKGIITIDPFTLDGADKEVR